MSLVSHLTNEIPRASKLAVVMSTIQLVVSMKTLHFASAVNQLTCSCIIVPASSFQLSRFLPYSRSQFVILRLFLL